MSTGGSHLQGTFGLKLSHYIGKVFFRGGESGWLDGEGVFGRKERERPLKKFHHLREGRDAKHRGVVDHGSLRGIVVRQDQ